MRSSHVVLDQVDITFDVPRAVAHAGLLLPATLAERLGIEETTDQLVDLGDRTGGAPRPQAAHAGACHGRRWRLHRRRRAAALRVNRQHPRPPGDGRLHGGDVAAQLHLGHIRQLDRRPARSSPGRGRRAPDPAMARWWSMWTPPSARSVATTSRAPATATPPAGLSPAAGHPGRHRRGAACPAAQGLGQHRRGIARFVDELVARLRRAGAIGELTFHVDSGFWSAKLIQRLRAPRVHYSITVRQTKTVRAAIAAIPMRPGSRSVYPRRGRQGRRTPTRATG